MIHTFSGCVLGSAVECDLDELLATRLVSFLMDHQQSILAVPQYLLHAISSHVQHLRSVQVHVGAALLASCRHAFCAENWQIFLFLVKFATKHAFLSPLNLTPTF